MRRLPMIMVYSITFQSFTSKLFYVLINLCKDDSHNRIPANSITSHQHSTNTFYSRLKKRKFQHHVHNLNKKKNLSWNANMYGNQFTYRKLKIKNTKNKVLAKVYY